MYHVGGMIFSLIKDKEGVKEQQIKICLGFVLRG